MSTGKKVLNVFGIVFAIPIDIVLVIFLMIAPLMLSVMALIQPEKLADTVTKVDMNEVVSEIVQIPEGEELPPELEQIGALLESDAAKELVELYASDITNALMGDGTGEVNFTTENIMEIVDANMDDLMAIIKEIDPEIAEMPVEELKAEIRDTLDEVADEMVEALPAPEEIKTQIVGENEEMKMALEVLGQMDKIKWGFIGVIVVLAILVFVLRLFGLRGLRWLAADLLIAGLISGVLCVLMKGSTALVTELASGNQLASSILGTITSDFTKGMWIRTGIMFACGLAIGSIPLPGKKAKAVVAKEVVDCVPVVEPVSADEVPATVEE